MPSLGGNAPGPSSGSGRCGRASTSILACSRHARCVKLLSRRKKSRSPRERAARQRRHRGSGCADSSGWNARRGQAWREVKVWPAATSPRVPRAPPVLERYQTNDTGRAGGTHEALAEPVAHGALRDGPCNSCTAGQPVVAPSGDAVIVFVQTTDGLLFEGHSWPFPPQAVLGPAFYAG